MILQKRFYLAATLLIIVSYFAIFLFYPLAFALVKSVIVRGHFSLSFFYFLIQNPIMGEAILNSLLIGVWVTLLSTIIGYLSAVFMTRFSFYGKTALGALLMAPMVLPPFVGAIGIKQVFGRFGMINSFLIQLGWMDAHNPIPWLSYPFWGVVILETLHLFPIMYLNIMAAFALIDPTLEEAGRGLGARGWSLFRTITLPLLLPGIFAGAAIVFIWAFTDLGTPLIFEFRNVVPVQIFVMVTQQTENPAGYALVVVVLLATLALFLPGRMLFGRKRYSIISYGRTVAEARKLSFASRVAIAVFFLVILSLALIPHLSVILSSVSRTWFLTVLPEEWTLDYFGKVFNHQLAFLSIKNSVFLSAMSTGVDLILGGTIAFLLARSRLPGRDVLDAVTMLPLAIPGVILAFGYVGCFSGTALDPRINPFPLLIISYSIRRLPLVVRALYAGLTQIDTTLEEAAAGLGAAPGTVMRTVTLPLILANIIGASILAFAFAVLEVSDSLILAMQEKFYPVTKAIYMLLGRLTDGQAVASAMGVLGMILLIAALITAQRLLGRKMGQMFQT
ncbi:MAG: iron ABC transporter permease [bacterium]